MNRHVPDIIIGIIITAVIGCAALFAYSKFATLAEIPAPATPSVTTLFDKGVGDLPEPTATPTPEPTAPAVVEAPQPAPEPEPVPEPEPPAAPTLCPPGTVPGMVDEAGNESNCQQQCAAWVDSDGDGTAETCVPYQSRREGESGWSA